MRSTLVLLLARMFSKVSIFVDLGSHTRDMRLSLHKDSSDKSCAGDDSEESSASVYSEHDAFEEINS